MNKQINIIHIIYMCKYGYNLYIHMNILIWVHPSAVPPSAGFDITRQAVDPTACRNHLSFEGPR